MEDVLNAGGISAILKELSKKDGVLNLDRPTITGKTLGETIEPAKNLNENIIRTVENPFSNEGGLAVLYGNIAPNGSIVKPVLKLKICCITKVQQEFMSLKMML